MGGGIGTTETVNPAARRRFVHRSAVSARPFGIPMNEISNEQKRRVDKAIAVCD